jgi:hypothetical protein
MARERVQRCSPIHTACRPVAQCPISLSLARSLSPSLSLSLSLTFALSCEYLKYYSRACRQYQRDLLSGMRTQSELAQERELVHSSAVRI